jgi:hypothetical protein
MVALAVWRNRNQGRPLQQWFFWSKPAGASL